MENKTELEERLIRTVIDQSKNEKLTLTFDRDQPLEVRAFNVCRMVKMYANSEEGADAIVERLNEKELEMLLSLGLAAKAYLGLIAGKRRGIRR